MNYGAPQGYQPQMGYQPQATQQAQGQQAQQGMTFNAQPQGYQPAIAQPAAPAADQAAATETKELTATV
jgi:hypothetical protein